MDKKTERRKLKEYRKMKKRLLLERQEEFLVKQATITREITVTQEEYNALDRNLDTALKADKDDKNAPNAEVIRAQMERCVKKLDILCKREKMLTEEAEILSRALKNKKDAAVGGWNVAAAATTALTGLGLSLYGIRKSHSTFESGDMVDKGTLSLAEKINPASLFNMFKKK